MILMMKPSYLLKCVFVFFSLILKLLIAKIGMKKKIVKPRKRQMKRKGLVIQRVKWLKIRIRSGRKKVMMLTILLTLLAYQMIVTKGNMEILLWERYTIIIPKSQILCKSRSKSKSKANESLATLRIILTSNLKDRESEEDDVEDSFDKTKQKLNNRDNHSKYGNRVCKLMQINKGSSWFGTSCEQVMHEINEVNPSIVNLCEANFPCNY